MAERQQAAETQQQIERAGEEREAQRLHHEHRIDAGEGRERQHAAMTAVADQHQVAGGARRVARDASSPSVTAPCPNSPAGRNISTITMTTKITVFDASG